ncbi:MAG: helix-turn-helix domain-containing protein [Porphyromonadaceae bacterium]|nr:helix-turn-helix domain-containing protein [Porphyromonadaceae bacterium]
MDNLPDNIAGRLKFFIENRGLTNSQFADSCEIPRPTLSQILSGRNKKISDILIGQIHRAYPELSVLWLLFGEGEMLVQSFDEVSTDGENPNIVAGDAVDVKNDKENGVNYTENHTLSPENKRINPISNIMMAELEIAKMRQHCRQISHVTVYYDDFTFETFYPDASKARDK